MRALYFVKDNGIGFGIQYKHGPFTFSHRMS